MAIVHLWIGGPRRNTTAFKRVAYISQDRPYFTRGRVEWVESGNLPAFAGGRPEVFWGLLDRYERINARLFTEIETALPFELTPEQNFALTRKAVQRFTDATFPYTVAVHLLLDGQGREQRHAHLILCERPVDAGTTTLPAHRFFSRCGSKKSKSWNLRSTPLRLRKLWCDLLNEALVAAGSDARVDAKPRAETEAVESKIVTREGQIDVEALAQSRMTRSRRHTQAKAIKRTVKHSDDRIAAIKEKADRDIEALESAEH